MSPAIPLVLALFSLELMPGSGLRQADDMMDLFAATLGSIKYWRKIYVSHYEEVVLGQCWLDFLLKIGNEESRRLPMPRTASQTEREVTTALRNGKHAPHETLNTPEEPFPWDDGKKTNFMNRSRTFAPWYLDVGKYQHLQTPMDHTSEKRSYVRDNPINSQDGRDASLKSYRETSYKFSRVTTDTLEPLSPVTSASPSTQQKTHHYGFRPLSRWLPFSKSVENSRRPRNRGRRSEDLEGDEPTEVLYRPKVPGTSAFDYKPSQRIFSIGEHESESLSDLHKENSEAIIKNEIQMFTINNTNNPLTNPTTQTRPKKKEVNHRVIHENTTRKIKQQWSGKLIINSKQLYGRAIREDWPSKMGSGNSPKAVESFLKEAEAGKEDRPGPAGAVSSDDVKGQRFIADYGNTRSETRQNSASSKDQGHRSSDIAIEGDAQHPGTLASSALFNLRNAFMALLKILRYLVHLTSQITALSHSNKVLACTTDYLWIKFVNWIDS